MVYYGFFDSRSGDRVYHSEDFRKYTNVIVSDGVNHIDNNSSGFKVVASNPSRMGIEVNKGSAILKGGWISSDASEVLNIASASGLYDRYDAVVIEFNKNTDSRTLSLKIIQGSAQTVPEYPTLIQNDTTYQMPLAYVLVNARAISITGAKIIDVRGTEECPWLSNSHIEWLQEHINVKHTKDTQVGSPTKPIYVDGDGNVQEVSHVLEQDITTENGNVIYEETIPIASSSELGAIIIGEMLEVDANGVAKVVLPIATPSKLGAFKVGDGLYMSRDGTLSVLGGGGGGGTDADEILQMACDNQFRVSLYDDDWNIIVDDDDNEIEGDFGFVIA